MSTRDGQTSVEDVQIHDILEFQAHFNDLYLAVIPRLLDDQGSFLALQAMLTAVDTLAGAYAPAGGTGERFRAFISRYFPDSLRVHAAALWDCRTKTVHALHPGPFALVCGQPQLHLAQYGTSAWGDVFHLNVQDLFAALVGASQAYFRDLAENTVLQANFRRRLAAADGGAPETRLGVLPSNG